MKRSPELRQLSRDHHLALYAALRLRRAEEGSAVDIRARSRRLAADSPLGDLHELGNRLTVHVRLEEDELFPLVERTLAPDALAALGEELDRAERAG